MPIYEYKCAKCGNVDEHLMRHSDPAPDGCTKCGGAVSKLLSQTSFALKGEGWYVTDYKPKPKGAEGGDAKAAGEAEGAGGSDDAAPAAAKEAGAGASGPEGATPAAAAPPPAKTPPSPAAAPASSGATGTGGPAKAAAKG